MGRNDRNEFYCISKSFDSRNTVCPPSSPRDGEYSWGTFGSDTFDTRLSIFHPLVLSCCSRYSRPINYFHEFMESDGSINLRGLTSGQPNCCWTFFPFFFFFLIVRVSFDREILPAALARVPLEQRHQQPRPSKIPRVRDIYIHDRFSSSSKELEGNSVNESRNGPFSLAKTRRETSSPVNLPDNKISARCLATT